MGSLKFSFSYGTTPTLVLSPAELLQNYLFGVPICNSAGLELTSEMMEQKILAAQEWLEDILYIKFNEQIIKETSSFTRTEWDTWGFVKTTYNVKFPLALDGFYNKIKQIGYPYEWLNVRFEKSSLEIDRDTVLRQIHIVPSGTTGNASSEGVIYNGATPFALFLGLRYIPNYWVSTYVTGFQKIPPILIDMVGKLAAIQLLLQLGDTYHGVGMSSYSVSLDGLSQNTSLIKSGEYGIYGSRIKQFTSDVFGVNGQGGAIEAMKAKYRGITWDVC